MHDQCFITLRPEIRRDYPLNLSISLSGGSETNQDSLSNGERSGNRPAPNPPPRRTAGTVVYRTAFGARRERPSPPDRGFTQRGCQACTALASASLCVLGVGLFGNAAQSGRPGRRREETVQITRACSEDRPCASLPRFGKKSSVRPKFFRGKRMGPQSRPAEFARRVPSRRPGPHGPVRRCAAGALSAG